MRVFHLVLKKKSSARIFFPFAASCVFVRARALCLKAPHGAQRCQQRGQTDRAAEGAVNRGEGTQIEKS